MVDDCERVLMPALPERPTLRPGLHVVRRDASTLQIGIDPPRRVTAPDTDGVRRLLDDLRAARPPDEPDAAARACLAALLEAGLVVDADLPGVEGAQFGPDAGRRITARRTTSVGVRGPGGLGSRAAGLLVDAGLRPPAETEPPTAWLVLSSGEPVRDTLDELVREGAPHLVVTSRAGLVELGPFVSPGRTACLRCVDAHRAESDPRRHLVVDQVARAGADGAIEPDDDLLWWLALSWAVRDLLRFAEGDRPSTWSTSFEIGPTDAPLGVDWRRHPHCGCSWDEGLSLVY